MTQPGAPPPTLPPPFSSSPLHSQVFQLLDAGCRDNARAPPQRDSCFHLQRWVLGEEGGERFAWVPWSLLMFSSKVHLSWSLSPGLSLAFTFLSLSGCLASIHSSSLCHCVCLFVEVCWSPRELKAQAEVMGQVEGKPQQKLHISLLAASQVHTPGVWCAVLCECVRVTLNKSEPGEKGSVKKHGKDWEGRFKLQCSRDLVLMQKMKKYTARAVTG